ncbi:hypothetical protein CSUI_001308 [Cystoisospora suis]|uniref:Uncharacterized protein n=1 Tax=Cystoisospora suis TaxID=483139 RepID=A0A2C6LCW4_9APIC|nr:hypothetical protein CSUI_001308 [Cystoisospora suis]
MQLCSKPCSERLSQCVRGLAPCKGRRAFSRQPTKLRRRRRSSVHGEVHYTEHSPCLTSETSFPYFPGQLFGRTVWLSLPSLELRPPLSSLNSTLHTAARRVQSPFGPKCDSSSCSEAASQRFRACSPELSAAYLPTWCCLYSRGVYGAGELNILRLKGRHPAGQRFSCRRLVSTRESGPRRQVSHVSVGQRERPSAPFSILSDSVSCTRSRHLGQLLGAPHTEQLFPFFSEVKASRFCPSRSLDSSGGHHRSKLKRTFASVSTLRAEVYSPSPWSSSGPSSSFSTASPSLMRKEEYACGYSISQLVRACAEVLDDETKLRRVAIRLFEYHNLKQKKPGSKESAIKAIKKIIPAPYQEVIAGHLSRCIDAINPGHFHRLAKLARSRNHPSDELQETVPQSRLSDYTSAARYFTRRTRETTMQVKKKAEIKPRNDEDYEALCNVQDTGVAATAHGLLRHVARRPPPPTRMQDKRVGEFIVDLQDPSIPAARSTTERLVFISNIPQGPRKTIRKAIKEAFSGCGKIVNLEIFDDRLRTVDEREDVRFSSASAMMELGGDASVQKRGAKALSDKLSNRFSPIFAIAEFDTAEAKRRACSTYLRVFGVPCIDRLLYVEDAADKNTLVASNLPFALAADEIARILVYALVSDRPASSTPVSVCRITMTNPQIYGYSNVVVEARSDRSRPYFVMPTGIEGAPAHTAACGDCVAPHILASVFGPDDQPSLEALIPLPPQAESRDATDCGAREEESLLPRRQYVQGEQMKRVRLPADGAVTCVLEESHTALMDQSLSASPVVSESDEGPMPSTSESISTVRSSFLSSTASEAGPDLRVRAREVIECGRGPRDKSRSGCRWQRGPEGKDSFLSAPSDGPAAAGERPVAPDAETESLGRGDARSPNENSIPARSNHTVMTHRDSTSEPLSADCGKGCAREGSGSRDFSSKHSASNFVLQEPFSQLLTSAEKDTRQDCVLPSTTPPLSPMPSLCPESAPGHSEKEEDSSSSGENVFFTRISATGDLNEETFFPQDWADLAEVRRPDVADVFPVLRRDQDAANVVLKKVLMNRLAIHNDGLFVLRFSSFEAAAVAIRKCRETILFDRRALLIFTPRRCLHVDGELVDLPLR